jgi:isochorismate hydrolase
MVENYLDQIKDYNIRQARPVPKKTALLVIDMQQRFRDVAARILDNVILLIDVCIAAKVKLFFTRQGNRQATMGGGMLTTWWGDITEYGTWEWEFLEGLPSSNQGTVIEKKTYDAFFGTELDDRLRNLGVNDIVICGVTTNCCCETTAREAFVRDFRVFFVADATATINEELHLASLRNLAYGFAYVVNTKDMCENLIVG